MTPARYLRSSPGKGRVALGLLALIVLADTGWGRSALAQAPSPSSPLIWSGTSGGFAVAWSPSDLTIQGTAPGSPTLFSALERWKADLGKGQSCSGGNSLVLLSVVGPILSYREETGGECEGTAHPWALVRIVSLDARKLGANKPAASSLIDLFPEPELLRALLADKLVQEALGSGKPGPAPTRLAALISRIAGYQSEDCRWGFSEDVLSRFAVHHLERGKVAVRIGLSHGCEVARGSFTQLGVLLPMPEAWKDALTRAAQREEGFLMQDTPKLFGKKQTAWSFGPEESTPSAAAAGPAGPEVTPLRTVPWGPSAGFAAFSPNGKLGLTSKGDGVLRVWDLEAGRQVRTLVREKGWVRGTAVSPDGALAAAGLSDGSVAVWDLATGAERFAIKGHKADVWSVAFSPDGAWLLSGSGDGTVKLWNLAAQAEQRTFTGHEDAVRAVIFAGKSLAISGSEDRTVRVWDLATGAARWVLKGHKGGAWALAVSPDGKRLLSGSNDKTVKVWDLATGQETATFTGHLDQVRCVAFASQGNVVASADDATLKLWDLASGKLLASIGIQNFEDQVVALRFSPDGREVLTGSEKEVKTWPVPPAP